MYSFWDKFSGFFCTLRISVNSKLPTLYCSFLVTSCGSSCFIKECSCCLNPCSLYGKWNNRFALKLFLLQISSFRKDRVQPPSCTELELEMHVASKYVTEKFGEQYLKAWGGKHNFKCSSEVECYLLFRRDSSLSLQSVPNWNREADQIWSVITVQLQTADWLTSGWVGDYLQPEGKRFVLLQGLPLWESSGHHVFRSLWQWKKGLTCSLLPLVGPEWWENLLVSLSGEHDSAGLWVSSLGWTTLQGHFLHQPDPGQGEI